MSSKHNTDTFAMPSKPGFYWIIEPGMTPQIVEVVVACTAHNLLQVLLPGDPQRYPVDLWDRAQWRGPLAKPEQ